MGNNYQLRRIQLVFKYYWSNTWYFLNSCTNEDYSITFQAVFKGTLIFLQMNLSDQIISTIVLLLYSIMVFLY